MSKRIISGVIGAVFTVFVLFFSQNCVWILNIITSIIAVLAMCEIFSVMNISKIWEITTASLVFVIFSTFFGYSITFQMVWFFYTLWMFCLMMINRSISLEIVTLSYSMAILISLSLRKIIELRDSNSQYGSFFVLLSLVIAWMSDTGAYFCGKFFGKNKLCPDISPKKTIEGFLGGISVCVLSVIFVSWLFSNFVFDGRYHIDYMRVVAMALVGSPISALGDLCFSTIKRKCHVKDFGAIMPGHGGVLDRFDSVIFTVPYVYLFLNFVSIIY